MDGSDIDKIPSGSFSDSVIELFAKEITKSKELLKSPCKVNR
jgi:hypothetical protein